MTRCRFISTETPGIYLCDRCGAIRESRHGPEKIHRWCDRIELPQASDKENNDGQGASGLGDRVAQAIDAVTFGQGHRVAQAVARALGHDDCGCDERRQWLNRLAGAPATIPATTEPAATLLLRMPHGLGDAVQLTVVLRHLRRLRPEWQIDVAAKRGVESLFKGLCRNVYALGDEPPEEAYAVARTLAWDEPYRTFGAMPATKAEHALHAVFDLAPQPALSRYEIQLGGEELSRTADYLGEITGATKRGERARFPAVLFHYQGNSAPQRKTLDEAAVGQLIRQTLARGLTPVVLDWDRRSALSAIPGVFAPDATHPLWRGLGTGDAATLAALIQQSTAMLAIDSGPGHLAGATDTPTLVVWTRHHPLQFYALNDRVRHAVPVDHARLLRHADATALKYFAQAYDHRLYSDLRRSLPGMFDELLDQACGAIDDGLAMDGDLWIRREHLTPDRTIVRDVYQEDCYGVDQLPEQPRYVVDVGAQLGTFAVRVRRRLAAGGKLLCVEPDRRHHAALRKNVAHFATIDACACTYDPPPHRLRSSLFTGTDNTGGSALTRDGRAIEGDAVEGASLATLLDRHAFRWVDLLKLDCEGCELALLEQDPALDRVRRIVGEWHDRERFVAVVARRFADWRLRILRDGPLGLFWLENLRRHGHGGGK